MQPWSINWFELLVNLQALTGKRIPVEIAQNKCNPKWELYESEGATMLLSARKSAGNQTHTMTHLVTTLGILIGRSDGAEAAPSRSRSLV